MTFSVNLLLDILSGESVKLYDDAGQAFAFERLALLTRETRQLEPGTLYIGSLERIEALGSYASGALIVCAGEESAVDALARKWGLSLLALPAGASMQTFLSFYIRRYEVAEHPLLAAGAAEGQAQGEPPPDSPAADGPRPGGSSAADTKRTEPE